MKKWLKNIKSKWNVTEELKQKDQMKWVQMMNNIKNCVNEIIIKEIIFIDI
ncbi:TnpV protein [Faecalibacillus intestinalis]|uniref:TnpV protein n=1 Tax=Faecalibacillus intestinalis TaxID=1982626 RepID=UPI002FD89420